MLIEIGEGFIVERGGLKVGERMELKGRKLGWEFIVVVLGVGFIGGVLSFVGRDKGLGMS